MADERIEDITGGALATLAAGDMFVCLDASDTTDDPQGTAKNVLASVILAYVDANATITESQISDLQSYLLNVVEDTTPQLGGALDGQGEDLNNLGVIFLTEQAAAEADVAGKLQLWAKTATPNEFWYTDDAGTDFQVASRADNLSVFAATTSAQLKGVISDETGSGGALVFATAPTLTGPVLIAPLLGTPLSGNLSSCTDYEGTAVASTGEAGGTKFLREDGDGTSSWQAVPSTSPAGADTNVQFNNAGSFGGSANFTWDDATLFVKNPTDGTSNEVLRLDGNERVTSADLDEGYINLRMSLDGTPTEVARMGWQFSDVTVGDHEGQIYFEVLNAATASSLWRLMEIGGTNQWNQGWAPYVRIIGEAAHNRVEEGPLVVECTGTQRGGLLLINSNASTGTPDQGYCIGQSGSSAGNNGELVIWNGDDDSVLWKLNDVGVMAVLDGLISASTTKPLAYVGNADEADGSTSIALGHNKGPGGIKNTSGTHTLVRMGRADDLGTGSTAPDNMNVNSGAWKPSSGSGDITFVSVYTQVNQSGTATGDYTCLEVANQESNFLGTNGYLLRVGSSNGNPGPSGITDFLTVNNTGQTKVDPADTSTDGLVVDTVASYAADMLDIRSNGTSQMKIDMDSTAGNTRMLLWDVDNGTLERVSVGAADSGGTGFKVLRIPN